MWKGSLVAPVEFEEVEKSADSYKNFSIDKSKTVGSNGSKVAAIKVGDAAGTSDTVDSTIMDTRPIPTNTPPIQTGMSAIWSKYKYPIIIGGVLTLGIGFLVVRKIMK